MPAVSWDRSRYAGRYTDHSIEHLPLTRKYLIYDDKGNQISSYSVSNKNTLIYSDGTREDYDVHDIPNKTYNNDVDIEAYVESLDITEHSIDGVSFEQEWYPITLYSYRANEEIFGEPRNTMSISWGDPQETEYMKYCNDVVSSFRITFPSKGFYTEEYGTEQPLHPKVLIVYTPGINQMKYNLDKLYDAYLKILNRLGYVVKENKNARVVQSGGICYMIWKTKTYVGFSMGKVTPDFFDISAFENNE